MVRTVARDLKSRVYNLLDGSWQEEAGGMPVNFFLLSLIGLNVLAVIFESIEDVGRRFEGAFELFEIFSVAVFTVEYVLRMWACTVDPNRRYAQPIAGRLRYAVTPMAVIDFLAIAPFYLSILFAIDLRFLRVFRLLRLLKLTRYSPAFELLGAVVYNERRALGSAFLFMLIMLVFASSLMHVIEKTAQPEAFGSIPAAMWWGMATLSTVGYGDVTPITPLGKLLGGLVTIFGIGTFALPAGILASGFAQEIKKRDFIVSWNMVAGVPLFARLTAVEISEVATLLRPRMAIPGEVIVRKGEPGDAMYFVASGRLQVLLNPQPVQLKSGDFFGEIALIRVGPRTADVVAMSSCQLLVLNSADFYDLLDENPTLGETIRRVAEQRLKEMGLTQPSGTDDDAA